jgi:hypothetical protein
LFDWIEIRSFISKDIYGPSNYDTALSAEDEATLSKNAPFLSSRKQVCFKPLDAVCGINAMKIA